MYALWVGLSIQGRPRALKPWTLDLGCAHEKGQEGLEGWEGEKGRRGEGGKVSIWNAESVNLEHREDAE